MKINSTMQGLIDEKLRGAGGRGCVQKLSRCFIRSDKKWANKANQITLSLVSLVVSVRVTDDSDAVV